MKSQKKMIFRAAMAGSGVSNFIKNSKIAELGLTPEQVYNADETELNWR